MTLAEDAYAQRIDKLGAAPLRQALATRTGTQSSDWYLVFKARQGMFAAFNALAAFELEGAGRSEVITQLYTCCTAVDPIVAAGLTPVYGDISPQTFALDANHLPVAERTAAAVLQHTYGVIDAAADAGFVEVAHRAGALVIEDCAHCAGRVSLDAQGKPLADISVHSFGVEKMLPTHFGGAIWVNPEMQNSELKERIVHELANLPELDAKREKAARHYLNQIRLLTHMPQSAAHKLRSHLEAAGKFEPAVAECERQGQLSGESALPSSWVVNRVIEALAHLDANEQHRSEVVAFYNEAFAASGQQTYEVQPLHKYVVFAKDAKEAQAATEALGQAGIYTVSWYRPLLFPGVTDEAAYGLKVGLEGALGNLPATKDCSERAICLATDISHEMARKAVDVVEQYL